MINNHEFFCKGSIPLFYVTMKSHLKKSAAAKE
jgi:hypothetical protein